MHPAESAAEVANGDIYLIKASCSSIAGPPPRHGRPVLGCHWPACNRRCNSEESAASHLALPTVARLRELDANGVRDVLAWLVWPVERGGLIGDGWIRRQGSVPREIQSVETLTVFCAG